MRAACSRRHVRQREMRAWGYACSRTHALRAGAMSLPCLQGERAFVWVDQHIRPRWGPMGWLVKGVVPTLVLLKFRASPSGQPLIYEQM